MLPKQQNRLEKGVQQKEGGRLRYMEKARRILEKQQTAIVASNSN